ncbi:MAG TPA: cache domain-containing protein [Burkholderiales bacterium]|nr:cache domain-containing protein [Burkholderiales bacterium]
MTSGLRIRLYLLALGALAPFALAAVLLGVRLVEDERAIVVTEALGRARAIMSAVDAELEGHIRTVQALAASRNLEKGDVRAFYDESVRVLHSQPRWLNVGLQSASGAQLFNAVQPYGSPATPQVDQDSLERALESGKPQIGNVAVGPAVDKAATRVRVPVVYGGKVRYVVSVPLKPQVFEALLREQRLPEDWAIKLVDGNKRFVARIPTQPPGTPASDEPRGAIKQAPAGSARERTIEGVESYTAYATSALSGWVLGISIPKGKVEAGDQRTATRIGLLLLAALAVALGFVWLVTRRLERQ